MVKWCACCLTVCVCFIRTRNTNAIPASSTRLHYTCKASSVRLLTRRVAISMHEPLLVYLPQDNSLTTNPDAELVVSRIASQLGSLLHKSDDEFWDAVDANAPGLATTLDSYLCHTQCAPPATHHPPSHHHPRRPFDRAPSTAFPPSAARQHLARNVFLTCLRLYEQTCTSTSLLLPVRCMIFAHTVNVCAHVTGPVLPSQIDGTPPHEQRCCMIAACLPSPSC